MRKLTIFGGLLGGVVLTVGVLLTNPWATAQVLEWTCPQPTANCLVRMRAMGHVWSGEGYREQAGYWYLRAATAGDAASMFHLAWLYEHDTQGFLPATARYVAITRDLEADPLPSEHFEATIIWRWHLIGIANPRRKASRRP